MRFMQTCVITVALPGLLSTIVHAGEAMRVPSDTRKKYELLTLEKISAHLTTRRIGPSGTSYSKKEVDYKHPEFGYSGDGDTLSEIRASKATPTMGPLVKGSISDVTSRFACVKAGLK